MGEVVKAITIESKHSWQEIKGQTKFSEKELNFNLAQLFNDGSIKKENGLYFITPSIEAEWLDYYKQSNEPADLDATIHLNNKNGSSTPNRGNKITTIILVALLVLSVGFNIVNLSNISRLQSQNTEQGKTIQEYSSTIEDLHNSFDTLSDAYKVLQSQNDELKSLIAELQHTTNPSNSSSSSSSSITPPNTSTRTVNINLIATCTKIIDGDTFELSSGKVIRLADVDAPESYEQGYASSSSTLGSWILGKQVYLDADDLYVTDSYDRYVCVVYVVSGSARARKFNGYKWIFYI